MRTRLLLLLLTPALAVAGGPVTFSSPGHTDYGNWSAEATFAPAVWKPGDSLTVSTTITLTEAHLKALGALGIKLDGVCLLVTAERTFDSDGRIRLGSDERMSTLLTPTGLAIEGGIQGAITDRFGGYTFHTPVDVRDRNPVRPVGADRPRAAGEPHLRTGVSGRAPYGDLWHRRRHRQLGR